MDGEVKALVREYEEILFEISNQYNEEYFAKGFELGAKIATEVFYKYGMLTNASRFWATKVKKYII